jgi:dTDP-4-amino-4,6-dideoxygalactose transaminase
MYRVDDRARTDIQDLLRRITPQTRVIFVTHYFGWPSPLGELATVCSKKGIKLVEDCALSLCSAATGRSGDAAIFSFAKSLPMLNGGALTLREACNVPNGLLQEPAALSATRGTLVAMKRWAASWIPVQYTIPRGANHDRDVCTNALPDMPASYYCTRGSVIAKPSRFALGLLKGIDFSDIVRRRRENYARLRLGLTEIAGLNFLWNEDQLPQDLCPLGLPILVGDRLDFCTMLCAGGVRVSRWWEGYHRGLDWSEFPEARFLKRRLIVLPVHQNLTLSHMDHVVEVIRAGTTAASAILRTTKRPY